MQRNITLFLGNGWSNKIFSSSALEQIIGFKAFPSNYGTFLLWEFYYTIKNVSNYRRREYEKAFLEKFQSPIFSPKVSFLRQMRINIIVKIYLSSQTFQNH